MTTLQFEVQDDMVKMLGLERIKKFLEEELAFQRFRILDKQVQKALAEAKDVNWEQEFEQARQQAYEAYMNLNRNAKN